MADGFDIHLNGQQAERLRAKASDAGMDAGDYARSLLAAALDGDWAEDQRRFAEYDRTGEAISLDKFMGELRAAVARRRGERAEG